MKYDPKTKRIERSEEDRARHRAIREQFKGKPTVDELLAAGELTDVMPQGVWWAMRDLSRQLRTMREQVGMSLAELSRRTGIDQAALSRLETGKQPNPTVGTICRVAAALGKVVHLSLEDAPA